MFSYDALLPLPKLGFRGLEPDLNEEELAIQEVAHRFAQKVMRPIAEQVDKMTAEEAVSADSPIWGYLTQLQQSGILDLDTLMELELEEKARLIPIISEELAWGDSGLTLLAMVTSFPAFAARLTGKKDLIEQFDGRLGCWLGTQPDRGSDVVDMEGDEIHHGCKQTRPNLYARIEGDEVVITGQSSAWVSAAPMAQTALAFMPCDYGDGLYNDKGAMHQISILIDLDDPRVSKGKPLEKIGQRSLPQGEIFFDQLRVPINNVLAQGDAAVGSFMGSLTFANMEMALTFTGVARAAFEHALEYVHQRKQGGTALINHQSVCLRLFDLWRKVESARAMAHRVVQYNYSSNGPHLLASITSKTFVTQAAFEVTNDALQLFGGNGLTLEYPIEKLLRDARASLIEDGENNILSIKGAHYLSQWYQDNNS